jgi:hypothetical protein
VLVSRVPWHAVAEFTVPPVSPVAGTTALRAFSAEGAVIVSVPQAASVVREIAARKRRTVFIPGFRCAGGRYGQDAVAALRH